MPRAIYDAVHGEHVRRPERLDARSAYRDDPALHRAVLAYMSDLTIQEPVLRGHGIAWSQPGLKVASLDHAMWWHRPVRVDEWLLYVQNSPSARAGRGLATGRIFTREGELVATVAQEIMVRVPDAAARRLCAQRRRNDTGLPGRGPRVTHRVGESHRSEGVRVDEHDG
jgi:acyl-CoA thioesterase-2